MNLLFHATRLCTLLQKILEIEEASQNSTKIQGSTISGLKVCFMLFQVNKNHILGMAIFSLYTANKLILGSYKLSYEKTEFAKIKRTVPSPTRSPRVRSSH